MIQQFLLTHCTYATSALEKKQGELANHPMGYSVRSASLTGPELRKQFHSLERYTYYYLPEGTPANDKEFLTADLAPKRLTYIPVCEAGSLLLHAVYRTRDTANRVGSYFAHALTIEKPNAWSFTEAIQTWGASGWVLEDSDTQEHVISPLGTLADILEGSRPLLNAELLTAFLTKPDGTEISKSISVIPDRWCKMPLETRCLLFRSVLAGFLATCDQPEERLLIVAEPEIAALMFYGLSFFLPPKLLQGASFSTFETQLDRLMTKMAATVFANPRKELDSHYYTESFFAVNTFTGRASELDASLKAYLLQVWKEFQSGGLAAVTRLCRHLDSVGAATAADLAALQHVDTLCTQILTPNDQLPESYDQLPVAESRMAANYLKRRVLDALSKVKEPEKDLAPFLGHPNHLLLLELAGAGSDDPKVQACLLHLLMSLSEQQLPIWIRNAPNSVPAELRARILENWVLKNYRLPAGIDFLWDAAMSMVPMDSRSASEVPPQLAPVMPLMLAHLDMHLLDDLFTANYKTLGSEYLIALAMGVDYWIKKKGIQSPEVISLRLKLDTLVQKTPLTVFLTLQRKYGNAFFRNYPGNAEKLGAQMVKLEGKIFTSTMETLPQLLRTLEGAVEILPPAYAMQVRKWANLKEAIRTVAQNQAVPAEGRKSPVSQTELEKATRHMAECAFAVLNDMRVIFPNEGSQTVNPLSESLVTPISDDASPYERDEAEKRQIAILQTLTQDLTNTPLLPPEVPFQAYLWKNLKYCLRKGQWHDASHGRMNRYSQAFQTKKAKQQFIIVALGGVCLGMLVVFIVIFSLTFGKKGNETNTNPKTNTIETATDSSSSDGTAQKTASGKSKSGSAPKTEEVPIEATTGSDKAAIAKEAAKENPKSPTSTETTKSENCEAPKPPTEEKAKDSQQAPTSQAVLLPFEKTPPQVQITSRDALKKLDQKADHRMVEFAQFNECPLNAKPENSTAPTDVLKSSMDLGSRTNGALSEREQAGIQLVGGVLEIDDVLFPFGFSKGLPGGMEQPVRQAVPADAPASEPAKARKKHVLQADDLTSTADGGVSLKTDETLSIPGKRCEIPALAAALGFESVLIDLRSEKDGPKYAYLQVVRRCLSEKDKQAQTQHREQIKKLTDEVQSLKTAIDACEMAPDKGGKAGETKPELFAALAKLISLPVPELQKPEAKYYTDDVQYKRALKAYEEKLQSQENLFSNTLLKAKELLKNKEADLARLKTQIVPVNGEFSENEKRALEFLKTSKPTISLVLQRDGGFENSISPFAREASESGNAKAAAPEAAPSKPKRTAVTGTETAAETDETGTPNTGENAENTDDVDENAVDGTTDADDADQNATSDSSEPANSKKSTKAKKTNRDQSETPKETEAVPDDAAEEEEDYDPFGDGASRKAKAQPAQARISREKELPDGCTHLDVVVTWADNPEMTATANRQLGKEKALLYVKVKPKEAKYKKLVEKFHIEAVGSQALTDGGEEKIAPFEVGGRKSNYPKKIVLTTEKLAVYIRFTLLPDETGEDSSTTLPTFETDWFVLDTIQDRHRYTATFELPTECVEQLRACLERHEPVTRGRAEAAKPDAEKGGKAGKRSSSKKKPAP